MVAVAQRGEWLGHGVFIGRGTILGNPHAVLPGEESARLFKEHAISMFERDEYFRRALYWLASLEAEGESFALVCVCGDNKTCHGNILKRYIESLALISAEKAPF